MKLPHNVERALEILGFHCDIIDFLTASMTVWYQHVTLTGIAGRYKPIYAYRYFK